MRNMLRLLALLVVAPYYVVVWSLAVVIALPLFLVAFTSMFLHTLGYFALTGVWAWDR